MEKKVVEVTKWDAVSSRTLYIPSIFVIRLNRLVSTINPSIMPFGVREA